MRQTRHPLEGDFLKPGHLTPSTWEQLACGELSAGEETAALEHVEDCADCAATWAALREVRSAADTFDPYFQAREPAVTRFGAARRYAPLAAAAVLAAALGLTLVQRSKLRPGTAPETAATAPEAPPLEVPPAIDRSGSSAQPQPGTPAEGTAGDVTAFTWQGTPAAERYTVELLDGDGALLWQSGRLTDQRAVWPEDIEKVAGVYYWRVVAYDNGESAASDLVRFELSD